MSSLVQSNADVSTALATCSFMSSFSVVLTGLVFTQMWNRLFMHIIFFISLADMGTSVAGMLGFPEQGTMACTAQAFLTSFFIKATIFWNLMLCYQLFRMVVSQAPAFSFKLMHTMIWSLSAFLALIPLSTSSFGRNEPNNVVEWCFLHNPRSTLFVLWNFVDWIATTLTSMILMVYLAWRVRLHLISKNVPTTAAGWKILKMIVIFPVVLFFTYAPIIVVNIAIYFYNTSRFKSSMRTGAKEQLLSAVTDVALFYGISLAFIFYWGSPEARHRWKTLIFGRGQSNAILLDLDENSLVEYTTTTKVMSRVGGGSTLSPEGTSPRHSTIDMTRMISVNSDFSSVYDGSNHLVVNPIAGPVAGGGFPRSVSDV